MSAHGNHSIAIKNDGTLWAWGYNYNGQLGNESTLNSTVPIQIGTENNWYRISAGYLHSTAIKNDGTLWTWGDNTNGKLGDGTTIQRNSPVQIGLDTDWAEVSASNGHNLAIKNDGTLWAWGYNASGQIGDGTTETKYSPIQIGVANDWHLISAGNSFSIATKNNGTLWAWGINNGGQLGDGTSINKSSPVQIGNETSWMFINAGDDHCLAVKSNYTLWAWGRNTYGQLGDGTNIHRNSPVQIGIETDWSNVSSGNRFSIALRGQPINVLTINLNSGWNLISSNVVPENTNIIDIFSEVNNLKLVKNQAGNIYDPAFGINTIGNWNINYGYWVYMTAPSILQITGVEVNPFETPINLNQGWNLVSYLRNSEMLAPDALQGITGSMLFAKDKMGNIYHPGYGINAIGNMQLGQGYWIYMSEPAVLTYPEN